MLVRKSRFLRYECKKLYSQCRKASLTEKGKTLQEKNKPVYTDSKTNSIQDCCLKTTGQHTDPGAGGVLGVGVVCGGTAGGASAKEKFVGRYWRSAYC